VTRRITAIWILAEFDSLAVSLAIEVYLDTSAKSWWNVVDSTMTFIFEQYKSQRIAPSPERIAQAYDRDHDSPSRKFLVDLHYGFCYTEWSRQYDVSTKFEEEEKWDKEFLFDLFVKRGSSVYKKSGKAGEKAGDDAEGAGARSEQKGEAGVRLKDYHFHDGYRVEWCKGCAQGERLVIR
jgi:hypothetical protein